MNKCKISLKNIKNIRKEKHLTQRKLSIESGISQSEISKIENDREDVKLGQVEEIAEVLHVCPFDLMTCDSCEKNDMCDKDGCNDNCKECRRRKRKL